MGRLTCLRVEVEAVRLTLADCSLLAARYQEHGNSHRRMTQALLDAGAAGTADRLLNLRQIERRFDIDLGLLCHWYERRTAQGSHPVERAIIAYLTAVHTRDEVWILLDRLRELRDLLDESRLVGEPES
jgi:hypothetical protein